jgi:hypothetical protein
MYGLPQVGILANKILCQRLGQHGYFQVQHMPSFWKHVSWPIWFNLYVNNFGVKYIGIKNLKHLFFALRAETYKIVEDWAGNLYCGINLYWNNGKHWVDIAMPINAMKNLIRYKYPPPLKPQHSLYTPNTITYGKDNQAPTLSNTSPLLDVAGKKCIQQIFSSL